MLNGKPVIRVFGKDENSNSVCIFYEDYLPYFYVAGCDVKELKKYPDILKIEKVKRRVISKGEIEVYKITLLNPSKTPEIREKSVKMGGEVFEADILFKYRFMADFGISGFEWIEIGNGIVITTNAVRVERAVKARDIKPIKIDNDIELKYMAFDIECISSSGVPDPKKDPIILISVVLSHPYKGKKSFVLSTRDSKGVNAFESEKEMLESFVNMINEYDPDIITAYNINNFDMPYILERMRKNNIRTNFGRCEQKSVVSRRVGTRRKTYISGRIVVDSYEIIKRDFLLQRYGLDFVAERLLNQKKEDVKHSEIEKLWRGDEKGFKRLVNYCLKDSILALNLILDLKLLEKYIALSKISGTLLQDTIESGEASRIENYLLREFNKEGYIFPSKTERKLTKKELTGGEVLEPVKGLHSNVAVLDFRSMYPSIIKSFNICPTTITKDVKNSIKTPSGARFLKKDVRIGIIPKIVTNLMDARIQVKKELKMVRDVKKSRFLYAKQWALKIMANAFYGYFGYMRSRLFNLDIANAITSTGRKIIIDTKNAIEKKFGYKVVYGDTDSVFVKIPEDDLNRIGMISEDIVRYVNSILPEGIELEFEKVFKRFLPLTKKRYIALKFVKTEDGWDEEIETKGIETVRRDWCDLVGTTIMNVIEIILKENNKKKAIEYFRNVVERLLKNEIPINQLVITKTMTKTPKSYAGVQPHIELVKKMQARNPAEVPGIGDRIGFVIVKGTQMLSKRAEDPVYVIEKGLQIDPYYYIENQLLPPLERIFEAMGISKSELMGNGKQIGIFDVIKDHEKVEDDDILEELSFFHINGFICKDCNKYYSYIPLIGLCDCGGELLFSSSKGPVKSVKVC